MGYIERKMRDRTAVRQAILIAAREIARKDGWQAVTIRKIAEKIEYSPPVVYEHFVNKADLINELLRSGHLMIVTKVEEVLQKNPSPKQFLREFAAIVWEFALNNPDLHQLMFSGEAFEQAEPPEEAKRSVDPVKDAFGQIVAGGEEKARELMFHWFCLTYGATAVTIRFPLPPELSGINRKELYLRTVDRFIESL
jgi:AcrR family transcriptional regulator